MDEMLDPEMAKAASDARGRPEAELPGAGVIIQYHLERRMAPVRSTISAGTLAVSWMSFCNSSPEAGWNSCWALSISARNSGSLTMASNAVRNTFTRSAGIPGGATIERPTAALLV